MVARDETLIAVEPLLLLSGHLPGRRRSLWRVSSPLTGQYGKRVSGSAQVGSLCCAVRYLCRQSVLAGRSETTPATNRSVRLSSAKCVLSGVATHAPKSVSMVYSCLPAT